MKNKVVLIVCYFGRFPNYFQLWLDSCEKNKDFTWMLVTDIESEHRFPDNVQRVKMSFEQLTTLIQSKVDFPVNIQTPYKMCDFKVLYGEIFSEYIREYSHWGHCDVDVIFGELNKYVTDELLDRYDRLFTLGHLSIYKNEKRVNEHYKLPYNGIDYKKILSHTVHFGFDEYKGLTRIYKDNHLKQYEESYAADINVFHFDMLANGRVNQEGQYFMYENGRVIRYSSDNKPVDEFAYIHLQKRKMAVHCKEEHPQTYYICSDGFYDEKQQITTMQKIKFYLKAKYASIKNKIQWNIAWKILYIRSTGNVR